MLGRAAGKKSVEVRPHFGFSVKGTLDNQPDCNLVAITFIDDPQLFGYESPRGRIRFVQAVGLTMAEYDACRTLSYDAVLNRLRVNNPLWATDASRRCLLDEDADFALDVMDGRGTPV